MKVLTVNIGSPTKVSGGKLPTGIYKTPATHAVRVRQLGLEGDSVCDTRHHGGADQAVYIYGQGDYEWWSTELGQILAPGTFGENLTLSELCSADYNVGDRFHIADVILEVTAPRIPCGTLAKRMRDKAFPHRFREAERPGLYCRVLQEGTLRGGDAVRVERFARPVLPIIELFRSFYRGDESVETLRWHLSAPLAHRARVAKEGELKKRVSKTTC
jgi:MOSC domain-containing protein YiiM